MSVYFIKSCNRKEISFYFLNAYQLDNKYCMLEQIYLVQWYPTFRATDFNGT